MQRTFWKQGAWKLWAAVGLSAGLLELPFPLAGPLPAWRTVFAWFALVPLLWALLSSVCVDRPRPLHRGFLLGYLCGVLWYGGNCYWVRDVMLHYGDMPLGAPTLLLVGFSLYLGFYFGLFGMCLLLVRRATGSTRLALAAAPILWAGLWSWPLRASPAFPGINWATRRWTTPCWCQLAPVDRRLWHQLCAHGRQCADRGRAAARPMPTRTNQGQAALGLLPACCFVRGGHGGHLPKLRLRPAPTATAVLIQPNLDVAGDWLMDAPR
jgi:hypothetical protein